MPYKHHNLLGLFDSIFLIWPINSLSYVGIILGLFGQLAYFSQFNQFAYIGWLTYFSKLAYDGKLAYLPTNMQELATGRSYNKGSKQDIVLVVL